MDKEKKENRSTLPFVNKIPKRLRKPVYGLVAAVGVSSGAALGANCGSGGKDWYYTQGPHADGLSQGQLYAVDIAPQKVISCPGGLPDTDQLMKAPIAGDITVVGNENDASDKNHSIVLEKLSDGSYLGFMHLADIKVKVGQKVQPGDDLGAPSCEIPPGGRTTGEHVHVFRLDNSGKPISVVGLNINGWSVNADGTLTKQGEKTRTADGRHCGPDSTSIAICAGTRNDIPQSDKLVVNGVLVSEPANPGGLSTPGKLSEPGNTVPLSRAQLIEKDKVEAVSMVSAYVNLLKEGSDASIEKANQMWIPLTLKNPIYEKSDQYGKGEYGWPFHGFDDLQICSYQMQQGQAQNWQVTVLRWPQAQLTQTDILNQQNGMAAPDRYLVGVSFTYRRYVGGYPGNRAPFQDYNMNRSLTYIKIEDAQGKLYIADDDLCFGVASPLEVVAGQQIPSNLKQQY